MPLDTSGEVAVAELPEGVNQRMGSAGAGYGGLGQHVKLLLRPGGHPAGKDQGKHCCLNNCTYTHDIFPSHHRWGRRSIAQIL